MDNNVKNQAVNEVAKQDVLSGIFSIKINGVQIYNISKDGETNE